MTVDVEPLKRVIDANDLAQVAAMMTRDPQLHSAPLGCGGNGPLTWQTPLDYAIGTYARSPKLAECIEMLLAAGTATRYDAPAVLHVLRGDLSRLAGELDGDPSLVHRTFPELDVGATAQRGLTLAGATLLHVAAEYGAADAARLLLERGANVDARAAIDASGRGGQTPIFHAVAQWNDYGLAVAKLFIDSGADLSIRATLPGHYERPGEVIEATPLEYATMFPGDGVETRTLTLLRG